MTETAQAADVFLPLSSYLETEGHLTNWCGTVQPINPIGEPSNGRTNIEIVKALSEMFGHHIGLENLDELVSEIEMLTKEFGCAGRLNGKFLTPDRKAHFVLYSDHVGTTNVLKTHVIEIDNRMSQRMKLIKA